MLKFKGASLPTFERRCFFGTAFAYFASAEALELEPEWPGQRVRVAMWQVVLAKKVYKEAMAERFETWIPAVDVTSCILS